MTHKENLLIEIYNLRNQIAEIKGNKIVNIDEFSQTRKFRDEAASWKEIELKLRIEQLKDNLAKAKVEAAQQAAADAFYATEEGQAFKRECEEKRALLYIEFENNENATLLSLDIQVKAALGAQWKVDRLSTTYMELAVTDENNKKIFGQSVSIHFEKERWGDCKQRFEINVGTCGSHELLPADRTRTMAEFYIGIGKLHAYIELLEQMRDTLLGYAEKEANIQKEVRDLDALVKNPTRA